MEFRRGFKTEANTIARDIRDEMGLNSTEPLDPRRLADRLEIRILPLSAMKEIPAAVRYFTRRNPGEFSAVTVFDGSQRLIVHNDAHSSGRQASDLSHELAHALLFHEPRPALDPSGCRDWDEASESEADWLGAALLVSEEAALDIAMRGLSLEEAARVYGCSTQIIRMRLNVTAAHVRVQRAKRYSTSPLRSRRPRSVSRRS